MSHNLHEYRPLRVLALVTGIDGKTVATTNLFTVPTGQTAYISMAMARVTAADAITVVGTAGIGVAAGEDDIFAAAAFTGATGVGNVFTFVNNLLTKKVAAAGEIIKLGIDVGFTATTATLEVALIGFLR